MSQNNTNANPSTAEGQETNDNTPLTYKEQLDQAAIKVKTSQDNEQKGGVVDQVVEKVSQYVPAVGNVLGKGQKKEDDAPVANEAQTSEAPGGLARPHHDTQIEEFVRDQHRSNKDDVALGEQ